MPELDAETRRQIVHFSGCPCGCGGKDAFEDPPEMPIVFRVAGLLLLTAIVFAAYRWF